MSSLLILLSGFSRVFFDRKWTACFFVIFCLVICSIPSFGQTEVCNDNKDNNGDGKIDCADALCIFPATVEKGCNCYDGKDNDGDGKIDSADSDCATYFGLTFVGTGSTCSINPPPGTAFSTIAAPIISSTNTLDTNSKIVIGDIDGDGIPDLVHTARRALTFHLGGFSSEN